MSDELTNATRIAALEEQVRKLTDTLESLRHSIYAACTGSGCLNAHELRVALDRERERCGVLETEIKATRTLYANTNRQYIDTLRWAMQQAMKATDTRHALDAAKFVGGGQ